MSLKRALYQLHLWLGLSAGLVLAVVALSGAVYCFEADIRRAASEQIEPSTIADRAAPSRLLATIETVHPRSTVLSLIWPARLDDPVSSKVRRADGSAVSLMLDPYSAEFLPAATRWRTRFDTVLAIHRTLGLGEPGKVIVGSSALCLVVLTVSGLLLALPRSLRHWWLIIRVPRERRGVTAAFSWHRAIGWWVAPIVTISALTGLVWAFDWYRGMIDTITRSPALLAPPLVADATSAQQPLEIDEIVARAHSLTGGAGLMRLYRPLSAQSPWRIEWMPDTVRFVSQRSRAFFHPTTGELLQVVQFEDNPRGERLRRLAYPVHVGLIFGRPSQFVVFGGAVGLAGLFGTGVWLFVFRRRRVRAPEAGPAAVASLP